MTPKLIQRVKRRCVPPETRFLASFIKRENGCWEWSKSLTGSGYGKKVKKRPRKRLTDKLWYKRNKGRILARQRKRYHEKYEQIEAVARRWRQSERGKESVHARVKRWDAKNRDKKRAHWRVKDALKRGTLQRQPCADCGSTLRINAHHEDYTKPLEVLWLCHKCHKRRHHQ